MTLVLTLSLLLVLASAWSLATFVRLSVASSNYSNDSGFEKACNLTKTYVRTGRMVGASLLLFSLILLALSSYFVYKNYR